MDVQKYKVFIIDYLDLNFLDQISNSGYFYTLVPRGPYDNKSFNENAFYLEGEEFEAEIFLSIKDSVLKNAVVNNLEREHKEVTDYKIEFLLDLVFMVGFKGTNPVFYELEVQEN